MLSYKRKLCDSSDAELSGVESIDDDSSDTEVSSLENSESDHPDAEIRNLEKAESETSEDESDSGSDFNPSPVKYTTIDKEKSKGKDSDEVDVFARTESDGYPEMYCMSPRGEETDEKKQLKKDLLKSLTSIYEKKTSAHEFAVGGVKPELPSEPGLEIPGHGKVKLPVTAAAAKKLKKHFQQAPYGLGEETIVDKAVRDSWQLDPEKCKITSDDFNKGVEKLVNEIQLSLGCEDITVTSKLYKLLFYEPGGHFKPHRDTEKHPGMFATLIIQLPSNFKGGDLVVKHRGKEKRVQFSCKEAKSSCIYAAHYADCEHELTEIKSGYRMALVYSLCWDGNGVVPSPPDLPTSNLAGFLGNVVDVVPHPGIVAWGLDHQYSRKSFLDKGVKALKGGDRLVYSSLQGANAILEESKKVEIFIVEVKRSDKLFGSCTRDDDGWGWGPPVKKTCKGDCFDYDDDGETDYDLNFISLEGKPWKLLKRDFEFDVDKDVLNVDEDDELFWGECHEGKCSGPSGNEGATKVNWYRRYLLVAMPKEEAIKIVYRSSISNTVQYLSHLLDTEEKSSLKNLASEVLEDCLKDKKKFCQSQQSVITMLRMTLTFNEMKWALKILALLKEKIVSEYMSLSTDYMFELGRKAFGIPSNEMVTLLKDLKNTFGIVYLHKPVAEILLACPVNHYQYATAFLEHHFPPGEVKDFLVTNMVEKSLDPKEYCPSEDLLSIGLVIFCHPKLCSKFEKSFFEQDYLDDLPFLADMVSLLWKNKKKAMQKSSFYQTACEKFVAKVHKLALSPKVTQDTDIDAIVQGGEVLVNMNETTFFEKVVDDVLLDATESLWKKFLASDFVQSVGTSDPIKCLLQARIDQLSPIVKAGKSGLGWSQPKAIIPGHPDVEAFLRGPEQSFTYHKFNAKAHAMEFNRKFFKGKGKAKVKVTGVKHETVIEITKLKPKRKEAEKEFSEDFAEHKRLQAILDKKCK